MRHDFFFKLSQRSREYDKGNYYSVIDVVEEASSTNEILSNIRREAIDHYRKSENQLFSSINRIQENTSISVSTLLDISNTLSSMDDQLYQIRNTLEWGFEAVVSQIEITNDHLEKITSILASPVQTQATEYAKRALSSLKNRWYEESIADFKKVVDLDPLNYPSWYYIGIILLETGGDEGEARDALGCVDI